MGALKAKKRLKDLAQRALDEVSIKLEQTMADGTAIGVDSDAATVVRDVNFSKEERGPAYEEKFVPQELDMSMLSEEQKQLLSSKYLSVLQKKLEDLKQEKEKLLKENDEVRSVCEVLKERLEETRKDQSHLERDSQMRFEKLRSDQEALRLEKEDLILQIEKLENGKRAYEKRVEDSFLQVNRREKELEHRLEIAKYENKHLKKTKDQFILDLKYQLEASKKDLDLYKKQYRENVDVIKKKEETLGRVLKTLRLTESMIEGSTKKDGETS